MASQQNPIPQQKERPMSRGTQIKRSLAQSNYISAAWTWFMTLAGKAAEPVLVTSVLYASVKLLPIVHFPPQCDVVVFIAQFVALDVGGLSLNKLADQARKDGNGEGAKQAKNLSIALVSVMLIGVIMAGVDQVVKLDGQVATVIDTILLIARAVMAVLYSRVIHGLNKEEFEQQLLNGGEDLEAFIAETVKTVVVDLNIAGLIAETVNAAMAETLATARREMVAQLEQSQSTIWDGLSQRLDGCLTLLDKKQMEILTHVKDEQVRAIYETIEPIMSKMETTLLKRMGVSPVSPETHETKGVSHSPLSSEKVRFLSDAMASRQQASHTATSSGGEREVDKVVWPLLNAGLTVRTIATQTTISSATVGRSRQRWSNACKSVSGSDPEIVNCLQ